MSTVTPASMPTAVLTAGGTLGSNGLTTSVYRPVERATRKTPETSAPAVWATRFTPARSVLSPEARSCTLPG